MPSWRYFYFGFNFFIRNTVKKVIANIYLCTNAAAAKSCQLCPTLRPHRQQPTRLLCPWDSPGNPLQCSCLETPRDGGAWWASIYGVAQSRTRLKRLSSSSRGRKNYHLIGRVFGGMMKKFYV